MRVLVTGGAGFIGSHVVDKLRAHGHEPVIYDRRHSPWHAPGDIETVIGEVTDSTALALALSDCDAVAHLAAVADVNDVHVAPELAEHINCRGTAAVLEACRVTGVNRIVYASTIWVYSDTESDMVDEETLLPPPGHLYTSTKLAGELYCRSYQELYGVDYTVLRFGIPYGPRAREAAVIPAFVNKAFAGEPLTLSGDGMQSRRFVYVEDLAEGVVAGLQEAATNRVYNLVSDEDVTIRQIAELVQEIVGNTEIVYMPARPGDLGSKLVSGARARAELGWTAATPFAEGVRRYVAWRRDRAAAAAEPAVAERVAVRVAASGEDLALAPAGAPEPPARPRKVLIISADIGEGHDLPARAVAREFREEDPEALISIVNGLPAMGLLMTLILRENSAFLFRWIPWLFDLQYRLLMEFGPTRWLGRRFGTMLGGRGLLRLIRSHQPDLIVSTYPGTTAVLGELRLRGRIEVPCYSSVTDLAGLQFWAHRGIDLHFVTHPESVEEVEHIAGPGSARWARPPTTPAFMEPRDRGDARRALGLPQEGTIVAVSGGGWGVGDLIGATRAALETAPAATVLVLCGHNETSRSRAETQFAGDSRVRVMGFTDQMSDVLAGADALIHSSVGLTVLEALIRGCPVISYGFGYGHVRASNRALERFRLAQVARRESELGPALQHALSSHPEPDGRFAVRAGTAQLILADERRVRALPGWRVRAVQVVVGLASLLVVGGWAVSASASYSVISAFAPTRAVTAVSTPRKQVGVMVDASERQVPMLARDLAADGIHVSFALNRANARSITSASGEGDEALPRLGDSGLVGWLGTRGDLRRMVHRFGWGAHFLYASSGPSLGQWLFAHSAGGKLVGGAVRLTDADDRAQRLYSGEVIELRADTVGELVRQMQELDAQLLHDHLRPVTVGELLRDSGQRV
jgi:UDP-glucose 4-epimerase